MVLHLPLDECIDKNHIKLQERKEKEKKRIKRNTDKRSKAKERQRARSLQEDKSWTPLARATTQHIRGKTMLKQRVQTTKPKLEKRQRAPPAHMQAPPEPMQLPRDECMHNTTRNRAAATTEP
jgi:hypothetical protein